MLDKISLFFFSTHFHAISLQDIRLVRDKFTHVSRGFAFVHFHSVSGVGDKRVKFFSDV